jgi:hypothetical protein
MSTVPNAPAGRKLFITLAILLEQCSNRIEKKVELAVRLAIASPDSATLRERSRDLLSHAEGLGEASALISATLALMEAELSAGASAGSGVPLIERLKAFLDAQPRDQKLAPIASIAAALGAPEREIQVLMDLINQEGGR